MDGQGKGSLLLLLVTSSLLLWKNVASQSNCTSRMGYNVSLRHEFDHAIILSHYIHVLVSDLYQDFVALYDQDPDIFIFLRRCHTASISTPDDKEQALKMHEKDLIILTIRLMGSWDHPLSYIMAEAVRLPKFPRSFMNKAMLIQENMQQLLRGLKRIARQVDPQITNYGSYALWTELPSLQSVDGKDFVHTFHHLCHCLHRDTHKADTFLKVLKHQVARDRNC